MDKASGDGSETCVVTFSKPVDQPRSCWIFMAEVSDEYAACNLDWFSGVNHKAWNKCAVTALKFQAPRNMPTMYSYDTV
ncbi:hypothetical protein N7520_010583 [Penicillium odoratum]|uniref:uncharacterized protein n=1 Tax=Penicillium odoratum TaxID=1167516 RepID=UPI0025483F60|nr:uncharacterized protein N7520_010583 [Penicillium odoratum]KAJ5745401.1 hypothetical protein N7520_010583 [Penicillium odoratum]